MAKLNINPTRMELKRIKGRLKTAVRGHKLLKDKSDEMVRQFSLIIKQNKMLREEVEAELSSALKDFILAKGMTDTKVLEEAIVMPARSLKINATSKNVMNVMVPALAIEDGDCSELSFPYSFASISGEFDSSILVVSKLIKKLIALAEIEKTCNMLAVEIQKNKRRVNALEFVMIPQMEETIKFITMKLEENERSATIRLMKVKSVIAERN